MKKITLGVSSSISIYKALDLIRRLQEKECEVRVIMTPSAARLVSPLAFEAISKNPVALELFDERSAKKIEHIELAQWEELFIVAPATANVIGKFACGIADDFLSTHFMASTVPVFIAPAMNGRMWRAKALQENINTLRDRGFHILPPKRGQLACGEDDEGALEDVPTIVEEALLLLKPKDFEGKRVLVTAGPTREKLDSVRFISNPSSGRMGYEIADRARKRGAAVTLISGPSALTPPREVGLIKVETAEEMSREVEKRMAGSDILFMAAAPSDYKAKEIFKGKKPRKEGNFKIELEPTEDILKKTAKGKRKGQIICGFAAEVEDHLKKAKAKIVDKTLDVIALNDVSREEIGFQSEFNEVTLIWKNGRSVKLKKAPKSEIADLILDEISKKMPDEK